MFSFGLSKASWRQVCYRHGCLCLVDDGCWRLELRLEGIRVYGPGPCEFNPKPFRVCRAEGVWAFGCRAAGIWRCGASGLQ